MIVNEISQRDPYLGGKGPCWSSYGVSCRPPLAAGVGAGAGAGEVVAGSVLLVVLLGLCGAVLRRLFDVDPALEDTAEITEGDL